MTQWEMQVVQPKIDHSRKRMEGHGDFDPSLWGRSKLDG